MGESVSEFYGRARFDHPSPAPLSELATHFEKLDMSYTPVIIPSVNGETIEGLHNRVAYALDRIITALDNDPAQPRALLICTHAATMIAIGRALTGRMPKDPAEEDFDCHTCSLSKFISLRSGDRGLDRTIEIRDSSLPENQTPPEKQFSSASMDCIPPIVWRERGVKGGWTCEVNGETGFLPGGAERGW